MADQQLEALTEITSLAPGDELLVNDVSDTTDDANGSPKKIVARNILGGLSVDTTAKTGSYTATTGIFQAVEVLTTNTANYLVTFPTSPTAGDMFGWYIQRQNTTDSGAGPFAVAPFYCVEPVTTTTINRVSYPANPADGSEKWGTWLDGEHLIFRYIDATLGWLVVVDGRRAMHGRGIATAQQLNIANATFTKLELPSAELDVGGIVDTTNDNLDTKRAGNYVVTENLQMSGIGDGASIIAEIYVAGSTQSRLLRGYSPAAAASPGQSGSSLEPLSAAERVEMWFWHNHGDATPDTAFTNPQVRSTISMVEVL